MSARNDPAQRQGPTPPYFPTAIRYCQHIIKYMYTVYIGIGTTVSF